MEDQTGLGDVDADVYGRYGVGGCREAAACGLEDEADYICGDEDPVEESWVES